MTNQDDTFKALRKFTFDQAWNEITVMNKKDIRWFYVNRKGFAQVFKEKTGWNLKDFQAEASIKRPHPLHI